MQVAGSESWRFSEDVADVTHLALFVRDAAGLPVPAAGDMPPRLSGPVPDRSAELDGAQRTAAAGQWPGWWRAILDVQARSHQGDPTAGRRSSHEEQQRHAQEVLAQMTAIIDPPEFTALADRPALQAAARAAFEAGHRFVAQRKRNLTRHQGAAQLPWHLLSEAAERTAREHAVPVGRVHGQVQMLMVEGVWWTLVAPGVAAASVGAARDSQIARELVAAVFESGLTS